MNARLERQPAPDRAPRMQVDVPVLLAFGSVVALLLIGSLFYPRFLTVTYLLQQLQLASFLGIVATGTMVVILLGHIDLSVPWTLTASAIVSTATMAGTGDVTGNVLAIPLGLLTGAVIGMINGIGVAYLRLPAMIWTLGVNAIVLGLCVLYTGGFNPGGRPAAAMTFFAIGHTGGIPNGVFLWAAVGLLLWFLLNRTTFGRYVFAIGNRERTAYLSGVRTRRVVILAFVFAGLCSATGGLLLAGYANQAYQAMGEPYLLPAIAAVVLGGTSIMGGRGSYMGTVAGVLLITLISSMLSVMQMPEAGRQITYGAILLVMLLTYGRIQEERD